VSPPRRGNSLGLALRVQKYAKNYFFSLFRFYNTLSYRKHHVKSKIKKLRPKKSILKNKWFWFLTFAGITFFAVLYFIFFSKYFSINNVLISGNKDIKSEDILQISNEDIIKELFSIGSWSVSTKSIILVNSSSIKQNILNKFPKIKEVLVTKKLFQTLNIEIKERNAVAIFCKEGQTPPKDCYFIDESGIIFEELKELQNKFVIIRKNDLSNESIFGNEAVEKKIIEAIIKIQKVLNDNYNVDIIDALITSPFRLNIKTAENWEIYLATDSDLNMQITKLDLLLKEEITQEARKTLQYIDLRFKDKAYYK
jgi:cell division septal protein FtsQ